jgi:hypothetical protein
MNLAWACSGLGALGAEAEEAKAPDSVPWLITLGGYAIVAPRFEGAARYMPIPLAQATAVGLD